MYTLSDVTVVQACSSATCSCSYHLELLAATEKQGRARELAVAFLEAVPGVVAAAAKEGTEVTRSRV